MPKGLIPAFVFHPDFGNEAVEGAIFFNSLSLTFRNAESETLFEIPIPRLVATLEEGEEGRVVFRDSHRPELTITTSDMAVLELTSVPPIARLTEEVTARLSRNEVTRRIKIVAWFCAGSALVLWLGMIAVGAMVRSIAARVPPDVEKQRGDALLDELKLEFAFAEQTNGVARLSSIAEPLLRAGPGNQKWTFHIVPATYPNAFAIPGGHIMVTDGLLKLAEKPEELLGVIAHEMTHVTHRHAFRQQISSAGPLLVLQVFLRGRGGAMALAAGGSALLVNQSFSQEYEKEADDGGWDYLVAANIDPRGMIEMFRKFKVSEAKIRDRELLPKAFSSHPDLDKRISRLEKKWRRLPRKSGFLQLDPDALAALQ